MSAAFTTDNFTPHAVGVYLAFDCPGDSVVKTRPAGTGFKLALRFKQFRTTLAAAIYARLVVIPIFARKCSFRAFIQDNAFFLSREWG